MIKNIHYKGLTDTEVLRSREKNGANLISPPAKESVWLLFIKEFKDPIIKILLIAVVLSLISSIFEGNYIETIGIFVTIMLATSISFIFQLNANKKFEILNQTNDEDAVTVIRNDKIGQVTKKDVVVGDIVVLNIGDEVPADGELLESTSLQVDESCLTGEASINKTTDPKHFDSKQTYASNHLLRGSKVINGHCIYQVFTTGDHTEFGKVAKKSTEKVEGSSPLSKQLESLAKVIGVIGISLAIITFLILFIKDIVFNSKLDISASQLKLLGALLIGIFVAVGKIWIPIIYDGLILIGIKRSVPHWIKKYSWVRWIIIGAITFIILCFISYLTGVNPLLKNSWVGLNVFAEVLKIFMITITLIVVSVPEGLPMSISLNLALSMRRMLAMNNLVRKMHAVETMGKVTVICTDKTGTLTENQMRIFKTNFFGLKDQQLENNLNSELITLNIATNSTAFLETSTSKKMNVIGNPTEGAFLLWLHQHNVSYQGIREKTAVVKQLPFSTERKYMATIVEMQGHHSHILLVKGAPEIIIDKCQRVTTLTDSIDLDKHQRTAITEQLSGFQNNAMRTLAFAYQEISAQEDINSIEDIINKNQLTLHGIAAISDPIRDDVPAAVQECLQAGISLKIVTGDTIITAKEISREVGLWNDDTDSDENTISGEEFKNLSVTDASAIVEKIKIMYRARPTDKQELVQLLKQHGEIVAVTGDGTNDGPALNYADVGLSMGSGTSVAKEASDITLIDDSFKSIATAVMWGRSLYLNIQRFILFQLTINLAAMLIVLLGSIFGHTLPLTVTQMLWVNLIMDTFAAASLAFLPPDPNVMKSKPLKMNEFIITKPILKRILITGIILVCVFMGLIFYFADNNHLDIVFSNIAASQRRKYFLSCFFTFFVMIQFWNLFNAKAFASKKSAFAHIRKAPILLLINLIILLGQILIVEFGGKVFRTTPISIRDWIIIIVVSSLILWIGEIIRLFKKKNKKV